MAIGFALDPMQGLSPADELAVVRYGAELGYDSAWTNAGPDASAFDRCLRWYEATGLPTGISAVPASGQPPEFYAEQARRLWSATSGKFTLVLGSGRMEHAAAGMRRYLPKVRSKLPSGQPLYLAALGPLMLAVAAELADGVSLNWCSSDQVAWSRQRLEDAAKTVDRPVPPVVEYIRTAVDKDASAAERVAAKNAAGYLSIAAYRHHFERMGIADELEGAARSAERGSSFIRSIAAAGKPGQTRQQFQRLAQGLDLPIVRILVTSPGDAGSARRVLEECRPGA
jgi:alkanesulfonate monooxygenase SsuD/methylene tetrahydromethanopterin reductase-like flavin-dependent oxidoreductase (luciferase family)